MVRSPVALAGAALSRAEWLYGFLVRLCHLGRAVLRMAGNETEFGGRGGPYPPAPYDLEAWQQAQLERKVEPARDDISVEDVRADIEARARRNDTVGKRRL